VPATSSLGADRDLVGRVVVRREQTAASV
jgi:hypothetical protein